MKRKENVPVLQQASIKKFFGCAAKKQIKPVYAAQLLASAERLDAPTSDAQHTCTALYQSICTAPEAGNVMPNCEVGADVPSAPLKGSEGNNATATPSNNEQLGTSSSSSDEDEDGEDPTECSAYELQRQERIARNIQVMRSLGLDTAWNQAPVKKLPKPTAKRKSQPKPLPSKKYALRSRHSTGNTKIVGDERGSPGDTAAPMAYDQAVLDSLCDEPFLQRRLEEDLSTSFTELPGCRTESSLGRIYSLDYRKGLLAIGGKGGSAAVFGTRTDQQANANSHMEPLRSSKLHKGWIADVQLLLGFGEQDESGMPMLLSASNDGSVCLWDLQKVSADGSPSCLSRSNPHAGGIFSMHHQQGLIATASKDCSVAVCSISDSGEILKDRNFPDHHNGVVKCVRFSPSHSLLLASCGNDRCVKLTDLRSSGAEPLGLINAHSSVVSFLCWHPQDENIIMTTAFEPAIHVFDLRKASEPLFRLSGHSSGRVKDIYQPAFVAGGKGIVSGGQQSSQLTMYCTTSARAISRIEIWGEALAVHATSEGDIVYCAAGRTVAAYKINLGDTILFAGPCRDVSFDGRITEGTGEGPR